MAEKQPPYSQLKFADGVRMNLEQQRRGEAVSAMMVMMGQRMILSDRAEQYTPFSPKNGHHEALVHTPSVRVGEKRYYIDGVVALPEGIGDPTDPAHANRKFVTRFGIHEVRYDETRAVGDPELYGFKLSPHDSSKPPVFLVGGEAYPGPQLGAPNEIFTMEELMGHIGKGLLFSLTP